MATLLSLPKPAPDAKKNPQKTVVALGGDGIGPEVVGATVQCLRQLAPHIKFSEPLHAKNAVDAGLDPLPEETKKQIDASDAVLFGAVDTENGHAVHTLRYLRFKKQSFANIRPAKYIKGIRQRLGTPQTDLVVVRELTEGCYPGREGDLEEWGPKLEGFKDRLGRPLPQKGKMAIRVITPGAVTRIANYTAKIAMQRKKDGGHGNVTIVTKRNVLRESDTLFAELAKETIQSVSKDISIDEQYIDDACRRLVSNTDDFDIVLLPNLFGDIFSDISAEIIGGIPLAPSACIGKDIAYFESCHGSAPDIAGKNLANPAATMLSAVMMLDYMEEPKAAQKLFDTLMGCLRDNMSTKDLGGELGTEQFTKAIIERL